MTRFGAIGIPTTEETPDERPPIPRWRVRLSALFQPPAIPPGANAYVYDFGDDWEHALIYQGEQPIESLLTYPRCVAGARRCPTEDCGGVHGYMDFLTAISDAAHPEDDSLLKWAGLYDPDSSIAPRWCSTIHSSAGKPRPSDSRHESATGKEPMERRQEGVPSSARFFHPFTRRPISVRNPTPPELRRPDSFRTRTKVRDP
jgi:hypothetical protein